MRTKYTQPLTEDQKKLVVDNLGLVYFAVSKYYKAHTYDDDIKSIGYIGLMKAVQSWNIERGIFATYAIWKIRSEIHHYFQGTQTMKRNDSENRLNNNMLRHYDKLRGVFYTDVFDTVEANINVAENVTDRLAVQECLKLLPPEQREVIVLSFHEQDSIKSIAKKQGITTQLASFRKKSALRKMKAFLQEV